MIQSGGWCRIRTLDEHTKLARFALNFTSKIDGAFKIDVSKMYVQLPLQIRKEVEERTQPLVVQAREIYDNAEKESPVIASLDKYSDSSAPSQKTYSHVPMTRISEKPPVPNQPDKESSGPNQVASVIPSGRIPSLIIIQEEQVLPDEKTWTLDEIFDALKKDAQPAEIQVLEKLFSRLREQIRKNDVLK
jgi:hypothetical protein